MKDLKAKIVALKKEKNAVILAHYYQEPDIQDIADYVGDSLGLSQEATKVDAPIILLQAFILWQKQPKYSIQTRK